MAVRDKRAGYRCESCRKYAILKSYRVDIRLPVRLFFIYGRKNKMDDETTEERDTAERDGLTPDEAHREGEFDDLRDMLSRLLDKIDAMSERIDGIYDKFTDSVAQMVENGATVKETDDAAEAIAQAAAEDLENLDYTM
nr:MAG TPA: Heat shock factor binding protein 1 [Caudoviricetes sp.]